MKLEDLKPGKVVFTLAKTGAGGKPINALSVWPVEIVSVDPATRIVRAMWNTRRPREFSEATWGRWYLERPVLIDLGRGKQRLATPAERASIDAQMRARCHPSSIQAA